MSKRTLLQSIRITLLGHINCMVTHTLLQDKHNENKAVQLHHATSFTMLSPRLGGRTELGEFTYKWATTNFFALAISQG